MGQVKVDLFSPQGNRHSTDDWSSQDGDLWATLFGTPQIQFPPLEMVIYEPHPTALLSDTEHSQGVAQAPGYGFIG